MSKIRVLHSIPAPTSETRYADHMQATASAQVQPVFFTWRRALTDRYDVFHLHWPEHLVASGRGARGLVATGLAALLALRLRLRKTPVVRTVHNVMPHETAVAERATVRWATRALDRLTRLEIHLVPEPADARDVPRRHVPRVLIPLGHYREPFAEFARCEPTPGRILAVGMLRRYKGVEELLDVFVAMPDDGLELRIVGESIDAELADTVRRAADRDPRISHLLEFVPDSTLVGEVSAAALVVLPYHRLHSSGVALVALSLDRPILVPESSTARALQDEVGAEWVNIFEPPLTAADLRTALARTPVRDGSRPQLSGRDWATVSDAHAAAYARVLQSAAEAS